MILLSSIINEFADRFLARYKNTILPGYVKAMQAMAQCRKEHGPHMLAQCTNHNCGKVFSGSGTSLSLLPLASRI